MAFQLGDLELLVKPSFVTCGLVGIVAAIVVARLSLRPNLNAFPTVGSSGFLGLWGAGFRSLTNGVDVMEGYKKYKSAPFKIADKFNWKVVLTNRKHIEEVVRVPDEQLSFIEATSEEFNTRHTLGDDIQDNNYHLGVVRSWLARSVGTTFSEMRDEIVTAFDEVLDLEGHEWKSVTGLSTIQKMVCRISSRLFVGRPLCCDQDWIDLNIQYTVDVAKAGLAIGMFPRFMRSLVACFFTAVARDYERGAKHLGPIIEERLKHWNECGDKWMEKPNDLLSWLIKEAKGPQLMAKALASRILFISFAAIHTTSISFTHALFYLVSNPQYIQPLREEVEAIIEEQGWSKTALGKMYKLDSFFKECQRMTGVGPLSTTRKALKDFTFSDGTFIPKGTFITVAGQCIHLDERIYENANEFQPFRFAEMHRNDSEDTKYRFISTSLEYLPFGHGRHACPGRFIAANEMKTMLAHIITTYDIKFEDGITHPRSLYFGSTIVPNPDAKVLFRRRVA